MGNIVIKNCLKDEVEYAKEVITCYVLSDVSYDIYRFIDQLGITKQLFDYCVELVKKHDKVLALRYTEKEKSNKIKRYYSFIDQCKDVAHGISTGFFLDNTPFDMLEFWRRIPFATVEGEQHYKECTKINHELANSVYVFGKIDKLTEITDPTSNQIIISFVRKLGHYRVKYYSELRLRTLCGNINRYSKKIKDETGNEKIIDTQITETDIDNIINYMRMTKLPFFIPVFNLVLERYASGDIKAKAEECSNRLRALTTKK